MRDNPASGLSDRQLDLESDHWLQRLRRMRADVSSPFESGLDRVLSWGGLTLFLLGCPLLPVAKMAALIVWGISGFTLVVGVAAKQLQLQRDKRVKILTDQFSERSRQLKFQRNTRRAGPGGTPGGNAGTP
jgi:hypothetical protein